MSTTITMLSPAPSSSTTNPPTTPSLSPFSISPTTGFLPSSQPLTALPPQFQAWDRLAASLPHLLTSGHPTQLRQEVDRLPLLSASPLTTPTALHRAFVVLGFLTHAYMWAAGAGDPAPSIPPCLAAPYLDVCARLGMQPTLSYAGLCLWNWETVAAEEGLGELENLTCLVTFTGTRDEEAFYLVPVMVEAEGAKLVALLTEALRIAGERPGRDGVEEVVAALERAGEVLKKVSGFISLLHRHCSPQVFYHQVRPFLRGAKGLEEEGFPRGCVFQTSEETEVCVKCVGGSAAQSSLFQFIDLALGVLHKPVGDADGETVFEEMRSYMPKEHRNFLEAISKLPSLRSFVEAHSSDVKLSSAYNECLKELAAWRSKHVAVVTTHIVTPARKAQAPLERQGVDEVKDGLSTADESMLQGTGGSALIPFLKHAKEETIDSRV